jgi:hypothetical protein
METRCVGITKFGIQCSRKINQGTYCWQHQSKTEIETKTKSKALIPDLENIVSQYVDPATYAELMKYDPRYTLAKYEPIIAESERERQNEERLKVNDEFTIRIKQLKVENDKNYENLKNDYNSGKYDEDTYESRVDNRFRDYAESKQELIDKLYENNKELYKKDIISTLKIMADLGIIEYYIIMKSTHTVTIKMKILGNILDAKFTNIPGKLVWNKEDNNFSFQIANMVTSKLPSSPLWELLFYNMKKYIEN